jgi:hypothetical protein
MMTDFLDMYSIDDLKKVITDREEALAKLKIPVPLKKPDFHKILDAAKKHIDYLANKDYEEDNDEEHIVYDVVIEAIYGRDVWEWINDRN